MDILIEKSPNDTLEYRFITLENNIDCLLVYDKDTEKSAASMDVGVGASIEPDDTPGLAHFLEHMLFMGTEKYPKVSEYSEFVTNNGGYCNAWTFFTDTNYMFNIANDAFEQALDIFSQFFISPLMDKSCVDKERNAVNSENEKNLQSDYWRYYQLLCNFSNPGSYIHKFIVGNRETLTKEDIVDRLKEFHSKYYSSNLMKLVLYSNIPLDQQEQIAKDKFSSIVDKQVQIPKLDDPIPYRPEDLGYFVKMKTVMELHEINFLWMYKYYGDDHTKPMKYISHILAHEGENSILSFLIREGLATSLYAGFQHRCKAITYIEISITLTKKGFENYQKVIEIVYAMINFLKQDIAENGPQQHVYEEYSQNGKLKWEFIEKYDGIDFAVNNSENMHNFTHETMQTLLKSQYCFEDFNKEGIAEVVQGLVPENSLVILLSPDFEDIQEDQFLKEKWYGTNYTKEKLDEAMLSMMTSPNIDQSSGLKLGNPNPNDLFPKDLSILEPNPEESKAPLKIFENDDMEVWYKKDDKFETPFVVA